MDDIIQTQGEGASVDKVEVEDVEQFPQDLEVFIEQNLDAAPPPILGQHLTFHDLEENKLDFEIYLHSVPCRHSFGWPFLRLELHSCEPIRHI